jgi:U3 small nucleolar RNA-associated protein 22
MVDHTLTKLINIQSLFTHPIDDYDIIIELDPSVLPRYAQSIDFTEELAGRRASAMRMANMPHVAFDPAHLLCQDLQVGLVTPLCPSF